MGDMLTTFAPKPEKAAASAAADTPIAERPTSVKAVFEKMPQAFRPEKAAGVNVVFQYTISGEGGGEWFAEIKEGVCRVGAGKHASPTCTLAIASADFLSLMNGKLPAMEDYTSGKLKIGGDIMKSQLIGKLFKMD